METTFLETSETVKVECPDYVNHICHNVGCPRFLSRISKDLIDDNGQQLYRGGCFLNGDTEWFSGCLPYKEESSQIQTAPETSSNPGKMRRHRGHSIFDEQKVHQDIESDSRKQFIKVNNRKFKLTRSMDWQIADQFLKAVQDREDGYVINVSTADNNRLSQAGKDFVKYCLERQRIPNPIKGQRYTGKARIIPGLLRANQL